MSWILTCNVLNIWYAFIFVFVLKLSDIHILAYTIHKIW